MKLDGDVVVIAGNLTTQRDLDDLELEVSHMKSRGITDYRIDVEVTGEGTEVADLLEQTVVGVFDTREQATFALRHLESDAKITPARQEILERSGSPADNARDIVPDELREQFDEALDAGKVLLVITVDELQAFKAREIIDQESRSVTTFALAPQVPGPLRSGDEGAASTLVASRNRLTLRQALAAIGPGIITGGADNDPAGITTYSIVGASTGYSQLWLLALSTPVLIAVQAMCAKVGNVLKTDLATAIRNHFGRRVATSAVLVCIIANVLTIGADLLMMAAVTELITGVKAVYFVVPYAVVMAVVIIFADYKVLSKYLLWLVAVFATYIVAAFLSRPDWGEVLTQTAIPRFTPSATYFLGAVGLLGTTITPALFFWQSSGEVEEERGVQGVARARLDIGAGMVWSNLTAFFIIVVAGTVLFRHGTEVTTAAETARALEPFAGSFAKYLFAVGIIGAGLLSIPVFAASTAYSVGGLMGWRRGLGRHAANATHFYFVLGAAILVGVELAIVGVNPLRTLFYSQVLNGLIAPFLVILILVITSSPKLMGTFANGLPMKVIGWFSVALLLAADGALVYSVATQGLPS